MRVTISMVAIFIRAAQSAREIYPDSVSRLIRVVITIIQYRARVLTIAFSVSVVVGPPIYGD